MLTKDEELVLNKNVRNYYHVVGCNAHFFGEPFLREGYLYYFDGFRVTIISNRVEGVCDEESLNGIVEFIIGEHNPDNVVLWGEMPEVEILEMEGYRLESEKLELWKREMVVHADKFVGSKKYRRYLRGAKEMGLKLNFVDSKYYKSEHLKLMFDTHKDQGVGINSISGYSVYPNFERAKFVEVLLDGRIICVNIIIDMSPQYVCFAEIGYCSDIKNISGLSKALLFEHYASKTKFISWGGCASEEIFNFKKEFIGETPFCFWENYCRYDFFKVEKLDCWLTRL